MLITPPKAVAYLNHGRWVADCPAGCNSAMLVEPGQNSFQCGMWIDTPEGRRFVGGCTVMAELEWPSDLADIIAAVAGQPPAHQQWAPKGHRQTRVSKTPEGQIIAEAYPDGQTAADLLSERV